MRVQQERLAAELRRLKKSREDADAVSRQAKLVVQKELEAEHRRLELERAELASAIVSERQLMETGLRKDREEVDRLRRAVDGRQSDLVRREGELLMKQQEISEMESKVKAVSIRNLAERAELESERQQLISREDDLKQLRGKLQLDRYEAEQIFASCRNTRRHTNSTVRSKV